MQTLKVADQIEYGCNTQTFKPSFVFDEKQNYFTFKSSHWQGWWIREGGEDAQEILESTPVADAGIARFIDPSTGGRILFKIQKNLVKSSEIMRRSFFIPAIISALGILVVSSQVFSLIFYLFR